MRLGSLQAWIRGTSVLLLLLWVPSPAWSQDADSPPTAAEEAAADAQDSVEDADAIDAGEFGRELRTVEEEVNSLKEQVFRSKATLQLLRELITEGATMGAKLNLWHINQLGGAYMMESVQYYLDGKSVFSKADPNGSLNDIREVKVDEQSLPPGTHNVQVQMVLRGGGFGLFSYLKAYQFRLQSSYSFSIEDGTRTNLRALIMSRGVFKSFEKRPDVKFEPRVEYVRE